MTSLLVNLSKEYGKKIADASAKQIKCVRILSTLIVCVSDTTASIVFYRSSNYLLSISSADNEIGRTNKTQKNKKATYYHNQPTTMPTTDMQQKNAIEMLLIDWSRWENKLIVSPAIGSNAATVCETASM